MGLSVIPTNIGGVNIPLAQLQGPLSKLFQNQTPGNLVYPSDLASNPVMGHAVQFSVFDYTTGFADTVNGASSKITGAVSSAVGGAIQAGVQGTINNVANAVEIESAAIAANPTGALKDVLGVLPSVVNLATAKAYQPIKKETPLSNISLFMPDTLAVTYNSDYTAVNMTEVLGTKGIIGSAYQDVARGNPKNIPDIANAIPKSYINAAIAKAAGIVNEGTGGKGDLASIAGNALGNYTNPQTQLLYKGIDLRTFTLEFILTPKSTQEAQTVRDICDSFAFYSAPGLAGAAGGQPGQYLTPPQIWNIKFKFLGESGLLGSLTNVFTSAMNNIGLGFLTEQNPTKAINAGPDAKIFTVKDCFLQNVNIDYAPNGWSAYNDGYPIQTRLMLTFKENQIITKEDISKMNPRIGKNYQTAIQYGTIPGSQQTDMLAAQDAAFKTP